MTVNIFMSDVPVLNKSCVAHLAKWITLFAEFKCFHLIPRFANDYSTEWENVEPCE